MPAQACRSDHLAWSAREVAIAKTVVPRLTPRRIENAVLNEWERRRGGTQLRSSPPLLYFDVTNVCNLRCRLCPTGRNLPGYPKGFMSFELYRRIIDELADRALVAGLYNWGEPLLHPELFRMIDYAGTRGLATHLSTNLNTLTEEQARELLGSRLDQLVVSCDGVDQESYSRYQVGGSFDRVMRNLRRLLDRRRGRKPFIIWQYLVMKHNQVHLPRARELAAELGVDLIQLAPINLCDTPFVGVVDRALAEEWLPSDPAMHPPYEREFLSPNRCPYLWRMAFFSHDGTVNPCCDVYHQRHGFGKLDASHRFAEVWNNPRFVSARSLFTDAAVAHERTICTRCKQFTPSHRN